ncbi:TraA family conjugative transfer protein [Rhodanobacter denitrificans]|nr:TraA family conjugative transfer protein [Rhodanobacter denitrificans]UJJ52936.1 TrbC/VirB2 family protein [Rhodanobacter denitrificans]
MSKRQERLVGYLLVAVVLALLVAEPVFAGTTSGGSSPFTSMVQLLTGWLKGGLGMLIALLALGVGLVAGVSRGSIGGALSCVGVAIAAYWGPDILQGIFGATVLAPHYVTVALL